MPVTWTVRDGVVIATLIGTYDFHAVQQAILDAYADPGTPAGMPLLMDVRSAIAYLSPDEIRRRGDWFGSLITRGIASRAAVVVGANAYRQRIAPTSIAHLRQAGLPVDVFAEVPEAIAWLTAPPGRSS